MLSRCLRCGIRLFLTVFAVTTAFAASAPVTVLLDFEQPGSGSALASLTAELHRLLSQADIQVDIQLKNSLAEHAEFKDVVLVKMKGRCSMDSLPVVASFDKRGPLAMTYSVDGNVLPFADVNCDRVRTSLQRASGRANPAQHQAEYGIALARVMAHELYHILAQSPTHTRDGITKQALSSTELIERNFDFSPGALESFHRAEATAKP
jgi:hypothetical protein